jgi:hypothetical protein
VRRQGAALDDRPFDSEYNNSRVRTQGCTSARVVHRLSEPRRRSSVIDADGRPPTQFSDIDMPAKDNDPKARKTPANARPKKPESTTPSAPAAPEKSSARSRRGSVAAEAATKDAKDAPKRRRSVRSSEEVRAESNAPAAALASSSESVVSVASPIAPGTSFEGEVRLRAYLIYAERGHRPGSPESDWFQAEREVAQNRQP